MNLETLQREMAASVMTPLTSADRMRATAYDGRKMEDVAASFIAPNSRLTAFERLEIYNRQYWFRVLDAFADDFTALAAVLGSERFQKLAVAYLASNPSRSFTLRNLGCRLTEWMTAHPEHCGRRHAIALDVARIEWACVEAFDSAACDPLSSEVVRHLDGSSQLFLQPHLRLLALEYPVDELVLELHEKERKSTSHDNDAGAASPLHLGKLQRKHIWLAVHRADDSVYYRRLAREEYVILVTIGRGVPLSDAIEHGFAASRISMKKRTERLAIWFGNWAELGWLCGPESSGKLHGERTWHFSGK